MPAAQLAELKKTNHYSSLFLKLCVQRGLTSQEAIERFIEAPLADLHDPFLMNDMQKAVTRIEEALASGEKIVVYGDYDADGVTSVTVVVETLLALGAEVDYFVPDRVRDGYGPNLDRFKEIGEAGVDLLITVDNGVAGHEAVEWAMAAGIDVIITDHHELPEQLPAAYAVVHPAHTGSDYPFKYLAGVGVAFKLACALLQEIPYELLDLVAIGTVADLVSMTGENRILVQHGLSVLKQTDRVGLRALAAVCGTTLADIDEQAIGFQLAPRINAVGRLQDASIVVELLLTFDESKAQQIAEQLEQINQERKQLVEAAVKEAAALQSSQPESRYVVAHEDWHEGILGIVANRLTEKIKKPMIVLSIDRQTGQVKGSARSVPGFHLYQELAKLSQHLEKFGGHEMAAGMSLSIDQLPAFQKDFSEAVEHTALAEPPLIIDDVVKLSEISIDSLEEINQLKPFGVDQEAPIFAVKSAQLKKARTVGAEDVHLKLLIEQDQQVLDIIAFRFGSEKRALIIDEPIDVAGTLEINEWQGTRSPQMLLTDLAVKPPLAYDERKMQLNPSDFKNEQATYIVYNERLARALRKHFPNLTIQWFDSEKTAEQWTTEKPLIFVDCPYSLDIFQQTLKGNENRAFTFYFYKKKERYLAGLPTRAEIAKVYKFIALHQNIPVHDGGKKLAYYAQVAPERIFDILQMFLEAKFVTIKDGVLNRVNHPDQVDLKTTTTYVQLAKEIEAEKSLIYSSFSELKDKIASWLEE